MATFRLPILGHATLPDTSGNVFAEPHAVNFGVNDRYPGLLWVLKDSGTRITLGGRFYVPKNYVGTPKIVLVHATTVATGDVRLEFDYSAIADAESGDPSADAESVGATVTVPATARLLKVTSIALTAANFVVDDQVQFVIARDGADAADTLAASAYLFDALFEYADA